MQLSPNLRLRKKFVQENPQARRCNAPGCFRTFRNSSGLTQHQNSCHPGYIPEPEGAAPSVPTVPIPPVYYTSKEEMIADKSWQDRWTDEKSNTGEENEDDGDKSGSSRDNHTGPSGGRRATVEDVKDEENMSSTNSSNARGGTSRTYHTFLNGKCTLLLLSIITHFSYS